MCKQLLSSLASANVSQRKYRERIAGTLDLLEKWDLKQVHPLIFSSLLRLCGTAKAIDQGRRVHACIKALHPEHTLLDNQVMQMYAKCGSVDEARQVFNAIARPNVHSHNILLAAYAQNGYLESAAEVFDWIPSKDDASWNTMVAAFVQHGFMEDAKDLFREMPHRNVVAWNSMVTAYAQNGNIESAWLLFLETPEKNAASWNCIIAAYFGRGDSLKALQLFRMMLREGYRPARTTFVGLLRGCLAEDLIQVCRDVHQRILESEFHSDLVVMNSLLEVYAKCGTLQESLATFNAMRAKDVWSWTSMISAFARGGHLDSAVKVFRGMPFKTEKTWTAMVVAFAQAGHMQEASFLFEETVDKSRVAYEAMVSAYGKLKDMVGAVRIFEDSLHLKHAGCWSSMIVAYSRNGRSKEAIHLLRQMDFEGLQPSSEAFSAAFDACSSSAEGKALHGALEAAAAAASAAGRVQTSIVNMYIRCGSFAEARNLFDCIPRKELACWNNMILALSAQGCESEALALVRLLHLDGVVLTSEGL